MSTRSQDIGLNSLNLQSITVGHVTKPEVLFLWLMSLIIGIQKFWNFANRTIHFRNIGFNNLNKNALRWVT
jgi:hypothetical protein